MDTLMEFDMAGDTGVVKHAAISAISLIFDLLKNTINIDKLLKLFMDRTNHKYSSNIMKCQNILKYHIR